MPFLSYFIVFQYLNFFTKQAHICCVQFFSYFLKKPIVQKLDLIEQKWVQFWIPHPKISEKQLSDLTQGKLYSPVIICSKSAKLTSKQCSGAISIVYFVGKTFESYSFGWKKDLLISFFNLFMNAKLFLKNNISWISL